jgi:hypothetical protein
VKPGTPRDPSSRTAFRISNSGLSGRLADAVCRRRDIMSTTAKTEYGRLARSIRRCPLPQGPGDPVRGRAPLSDSNWGPSPGLAVPQPVRGRELNATLAPDAQNHEWEVKQWCYLGLRYCNSSRDELRYPVLWWRNRASASLLHRDVDQSGPSTAGSLPRADR